MAIELNLLPEKVKKEKKVQVVYTYAILGGVVVVALLATLVIMKKQESARLDEEIKQKNDLISKIQDKVDKYNGFKKMERGYDNKKKIVDDLLKKQSIWPKLLDRVGTLVLPDMWLTALKYIRDKENGIVLNISGNALSEVIIADFIKRLEQSRYMTDVTTTSMKDTNNSTLGLAFEISVVYDIDFEESSTSSQPLQTNETKTQ